MISISMLTSVRTLCFSPGIGPQAAQAIPGTNIGPSMAQNCLRTYTWTVVSRTFPCLLLGLCSFAHAVYATPLTVIGVKGATVSAQPFYQKFPPKSKKVLMAEMLRAYKNRAKPHISINQILYPNHSEFTPGPVTKHKIANDHLKHVTLFLVGNDSRSLKWLKQNKAYLQRIHAMGFLTNVDNAAQARKVEKVYGEPLLSANVKGFSKVVGTTHIPFLLKDLWVMQ